MRTGPLPRKPVSTAQAGARGFIVIAVLWILAALSALELIYLTFVTSTAVVVAGSADPFCRSGGADPVAVSRDVCLRRA